ncbi:hypothetical protein BDV95DRAFT_24384 [Massariosphaeria phaeospora]|uniref:Uncharacterized protein n=1 Tax=Massariosphaeria phaeospora TaxID=100035 RepID=A0A7C8MKP5_9PLEO|nr:hypothetical protein BDV95DRAFT_24384 [Massariosphaeria phaeospora]
MVVVGKHHVVIGPLAFLSRRTIHHVVVACWAGDGLIQHDTLFGSRCRQSTRCSLSDSIVPILRNYNSHKQPLDQVVDFTTAQFGSFTTHQALIRQYRRSLSKCSGNPKERRINDDAFHSTADHSPVSVSLHAGVLPSESSRSHRRNPAAANPDFLLCISSHPTS